MSSHFEVNSDGWITFNYDSKSLLICWIPNDLLPELYYPQTKLIIGHNPVQLDLSSLAHGSEWIKCYQKVLVHAW
jgi:hypothetical protein